MFWSGHWPRTQIFWKWKWKQRLSKIRKEGLNVSHCLTPKIQLKCIFSGKNRLLLFLWSLLCSQSLFMCFGDERRLDTRSNLHSTQKHMNSDCAPVRLGHHFCWQYDMTNTSFYVSPFIIIGPLTQISPSWFGPRILPVSGSMTCVHAVDKRALYESYVSSSW